MILREDQNKTHNTICKQNCVLFLGFVNKKLMKKSIFIDSILYIRHVVTAFINMARIRKGNNN